MRRRSGRVPSDPCTAPVPRGASTRRGAGRAATPGYFRPLRVPERRLGGCGWFEWDGGEETEMRAHTLRRSDRDSWTTADASDRPTLQARTVKL